ncbi:Imm32 family immunity protein [Micromonospora chersina]
MRRWRITGAAVFPSMIVSWSLPVRRLASAPSASCYATMLSPLRSQITGGVVSQEATAGALLVSLLGGTKLHFSGAREYLDIIWDALDGVTEQAETADDRTINRHQHIEYLQGDDYRSPDSVPLVIVADWPDAP